MFKQNERTNNNFKPQLSIYYNTMLSNSLKYKADTESLEIQHFQKLVMEEQCFCQNVWCG